MGRVLVESVCASRILDAHAYGTVFGRGVGAGRKTPPWSQGQGVSLRAERRAGGAKTDGCLRPSIHWVITFGCSVWVSGISLAEVGLFVPGFGRSRTKLADLGPLMAKLSSLGMLAEVVGESGSANTFGSPGRLGRQAILVKGQMVGVSRDHPFGPRTPFRLEAPR